MAIVGTMAIVIFDLLYGFLRQVGEAPSELTFEGFLSQAREKALMEGKILTLFIDLENKEFGLRFFDPTLERSIDPSLAQLEKNRNFRLQRDTQEVKQENKKEPAWILEKRKLPDKLVRIHSVTGLLLAGPYIYIHFYPDGSSDSFILEFDREENRYLYIPRQNLPPRYLADLGVSEKP